MNDVVEAGGEGAVYNYLLLAWPDSTWNVAALYFLLDNLLVWDLASCLHNHASREEANTAKQ